MSLQDTAKQKWEKWVQKTEQHPEIIEPDPALYW